jgi:hypothetical protein
MLKQQTRWRANRGARALKRLSEIDAAIVALLDEDLLDLADIFSGARSNPLSDAADAEMKRRNISL